MEIAPCITGTSAEAILTLPCHLLEDHPLRLSFYSQAHLAGLTASIEESGLFEPVLVCPLDGGKYRILSGHYRVRAVRRLRQPEILCRVYHCDSRMELVIYCTSNLSAGDIAKKEARCPRAPGYSHNLAHLWPV